MIKVSIRLQDLKQRIYDKAKVEPTWCFWGLYVHVCKMEPPHVAMLSLALAAELARAAGHSLAQALASG